MNTQKLNSFALIEGAIVFECAPVWDILNKIEERQELSYLLNGFEAEGQKAGAIFAQTTDEELNALKEIAVKKPLHFLSWLETEFDALRRSTYWAKYFNLIPLEDGQEMFLRFADTRVLAYLPQVMSPVQWRVFTTPHSKMDIS